MKYRATHAAVLMGLALNAVGAPPPIPREYLGKYVPVGESCNSSHSLVVSQDFVDLVSEGSKRRASSLDLCYTCEGGVRYAGNALWVFAGAGPQDAQRFIVRLRPDEKKNRAVVDIPEKAMKSQFPLHGRQLRKCGT